MNEQPTKKGMSKGCMITLIVVGIVLIMIIAAAVTCWVKRDDLARYAALSIVEGARVELQNNPVEGIDTEQFGVMVDSFKEKLNNNELDYDRYSVFIQRVQNTAMDQQFDPEEYELLIDAMVEYFPDLEEFRPEPMVEDSTMVEDTLPPSE